MSTNREKCKHCGTFMLSSRMAIHLQACKPTFFPFNPPGSKQSPVVLSPPVSLPVKKVRSGSQLQSAIQIPIAHPAPPSNLPKQPHPRPGPGVIKSLQKGPGRTCRYCQQLFYSRARDHLAKCGSAVQCRNCGDYCAKGMIRSHLLNQCRAGGI